MSEETGKMNAWLHRFEEFFSGFPSGSDGKEWVWSLDEENPLEKGMATQYSCLTNSTAEEPGGLQSMDHRELDTTEQLTLWLTLSDKGMLKSLG